MKRNKGFTLIELLAVIAILGILITISTIAVNTLRKKQEAKNKLNVISSILTGAKEYNADKRIPVGTPVLVQELKDGDYVDFDENKYSDLLNLNVKKEQCDNKLKIKYSITVKNENNEEIIYNDCGCEKQPENGSSIKSSELCTG